MTQMGLEYMKHKETSRHNKSDEGIRQESNVISQQDADTRKYVSSFKPQEVGATMQQAKASERQADTASGKLELDTHYRERETQAKEDSAVAQLSQAEASHIRNEIQKAKSIMDNLSTPDAASMASQLRGDGYVSQALSGLNAVLDSLLGALRFSVK